MAFCGLKKISLCDVDVDVNKKNQAGRLIPPRLLSPLTARGAVTVGQDLKDILTFLQIFSLCSKLTVDILAFASCLVGTMICPL